MRFLLSATLILSSFAVFAHAETPSVIASPEQISAAAPSLAADMPDAPQPVQPANPDASPITPATPVEQSVPLSKQQPKRILGIMPNYRAVSAGAPRTEPTPKQSFIMATRNSFDYSSFLFTGITSVMAEGENAHPQLGKGAPGFWSYYWRGYVDKTDGNYLVLAVLPTIFHQDERYYTMGEGGIPKRTAYALSSILIAPTYQGNKSFNISELLGRGIAQGVSMSYYPSQDRTVGTIASKYGYAIMRDALTNTFREFWPDIAVHVLHRHP